MILVFAVLTTFSRVTNRFAVFYYRSATKLFVALPRLTSANLPFRLFGLVGARCAHHKCIENRLCHGNLCRKTQLICFDGVHTLTIRSLFESEEVLGQSMASRVY